MTCLKQVARFYFPNLKRRRNLIRRLICIKRLQTNLLYQMMEMAHLTLEIMLVVELQMTNPPRKKVIKKKAKSAIKPLFNLQTLRFKIHLVKLKGQLQEVCRCKMIHLNNQFMQLMYMIHPSSAMINEKLQLRLETVSILRKWRWAQHFSTLG